MNKLKIFKESLLELKDVRCLAITGVLVGLSIIIEMHSITLRDLKFNFAFLALAAVGMYYGPIVAMLAAIPCDIIGASITPGGGILLEFTLIAMFEGFIYGVFLYKYKLDNLKRIGISNKDDKNRFFDDISSWLKYLKNNFRIVFAQTIVSLISHIILNTAVLYRLGYLGPAETIWIRITARAIKNIVVLPVEIIILFTVLIPLRVIYNKTHGKLSERNKING